ncbi:MAG TPA: ROK family protein, partial [Pyrinomonadaceae bacterium]|nr:ROK family protein [Pyrinomonadaceae bacterium]
MNANSVIAVDLGGTNLRAARINGDGRIISRARTTTPANAEDPKVVVDALLNAIHQCAGDALFAKAAVVVPGSVDPTGQKIIKAPHLPCLNNYELKEVLESSLGVDVILENDANAAGVGEQWLGAAKGCDSLVCLTLGTGIGGGIIINGELWRGAQGAAGEVGHTTVEPGSEIKCDCGNTGCLELFTSATGITRMARLGLPTGSRFDLPPGELTARSVFEAAVKDDKLAIEIFETVGKYLGIAIANLADILNPETFVLGGGVANAWSMFE